MFLIAAIVILLIVLLILGQAIRIVPQQSAWVVERLGRRAPRN